MPPPEFCHSSSFEDSCLWGGLLHRVALVDLLLEVGFYGEGKFGSFVVRDIKKMTSMSKQHKVLHG